MEKLLADGLCRSIGVSNYTIRHLKELLDYCHVVPVVNQVEFTPFLYQQELLSFCRQVGVHLQAYSPLAKGRRFNEEVLLDMAGRTGRSPAQLMIRWALQHDLLVVTRSTKRQHLLENMAAFEFSLEPADMEILDSLNDNYRTQKDPATMP